MRKKVKKLLRFFGFQATNTFKLYPLQKNNVFNTSFKKRVLISYITTPFSLKINFSHSNLLECYTAAEIFHNMGYTVDVIDFLSRKKIDHKKYEIIYGMGNALEASFYDQSTNMPLRIYYGTGCNPIYSNIETTLKVRSFFKKHDRILMESSRILERSSHAQILLSDLVLILGNDFVLDTYKRYDLEGAYRYKRLNAFFFDVYDIDLNQKEYSTAKKNFLWFGSSGLLHKGLDTLLDIFSTREDIYLHICGASAYEKGFHDHYNDLISRSKNIVNHGFVNIGSENFKTIMNLCGFIISPSISEGGAVALLNTMANGGLVPIISKSCGLDLENYGWVVDKVDIDMFSIAINEALLLSDQSVKEKSIKVKAHVRDIYTYEHYKNNMKDIIISQVDGTSS